MQYWFAKWIDALLSDDYIVTYPKCKQTVYVGFNNNVLNTILYLLDKLFIGRKPINAK